MLVSNPASFFLVARIFLVLSVFVLQAAAEEGATVSCQVSLKSDVVKQGESPEVTVELRNDGAKPIVLPGCLDGSDAEKRYPHCRFEVFDARGGAAKISEFSRCGNMCMLKASDFVVLKPGESFDPTGSGFFAPLQRSGIRGLDPGLYELCFVYETAKDGIEKYMGDERRMSDEYAQKRGARTMDVRVLYSLTPAVKVMSNRVAFRVE